MAQISLNMAWDQTKWRYKPYKTTQHPSVKKNYNHFRLNCLQPFIPDLSAKTAFLWAQITNWDWNPSTNSAFHQPGAWICNWLLHTNLTYYDQENPVTIQTDTRKYRLGTALLQNGCPIAFTSKTHTHTETRYAKTKGNVYLYASELRNFILLYMADMSPPRTITNPLMIQHKPCSLTSPTENAFLNAEIQLYDQI